MLSMVSRIFKTGRKKCTWPIVTTVLPSSFGDKPTLGIFFMSLNIIGDLALGIGRAI
jgi:hypothetical protein